VGLVGAAVNRALVFLEASHRAKGWPWVQPEGPGGGVFAVSIVLHLGIATATTAALATTAIITNGFIAFGTGAAAPVVVKKVASLAMTLAPSGETDGQQPPNQGGGDVT
jgi:hypothetical protein